MTPVRFTPAERAAAASRVRAWLRDELDVEIGELPSEVLLDVLGAEIGPWFYNRGLYDAQAIVAARADDIADAILNLEKPTGR